MNLLRSERDETASDEVLRRLYSAMQEEQDYLTCEVLARNLHRAYEKDTTGIAGQWLDLDEDGRKLWRAMAKRAVRKIDELRHQASQAPGNRAPAAGPEIDRTQTAFPVTEPPADVPAAAG